MSRQKKVDESVFSAGEHGFLEEDPTAPGLLSGHDIQALPAVFNPLTGGSVGLLQVSIWH